MKQVIANWLGACLLLGYCGVVQAQRLPYVSGDASAPECVDALNFASQVYASTSPYLYAPEKMPSNLDSVMILGTTDVDISGGDALTDMGRDHFSRPFHNERDPNYPHIYWGRDITNGVRLAVTADGAGWRGDMYSVYELPATVAPQQFRSTLASRFPSQEKYKQFIDKNWRPPFVFWSQKTQQPWLIDVGGSYELDGSWKVFLKHGDAYDASCFVHFWPTVSPNRAPSALPHQVKHFKALLYRTLGYDGPLSGTMQPIAALRMSAEHVWVNLAYRPWSLSDKDAGNSTEQVDNGLLSWSHNSASNERLYVDIQRNYLATQSALKEYYRSHFGLSKVAAEHFSRWALDIAYRATFSFDGYTPGSQKSNSTNPNPWVGSNLGYPTSHSSERATRAVEFKR